MIWAGSDDGLVQRHPRRRQDLEERHAQGDAGVDHDQRRSTPARSTRGPPTSPRRCTSRTTSAPTSTRRRTTAPPGRASTTASIPRHFTRVVRADPRAAGLLYAGTERGIYVSFDDGARWQPLQLNLPIVPVTDLTIKDGSLVAATQGRGFWMLDDLRRCARSPPARPRRRRASTSSRPPPPTAPGTAAAPPAAGEGRTRRPGGRRLLPQGGAAGGAGQGVKLEILTRDGKVIRAFHGKPAEMAKERRRAGRRRPATSGRGRKRRRRPPEAGRDPPARPKAAKKERRETAEERGRRGGEAAGRGGAQPLRLGPGLAGRRQVPRPGAVDRRPGAPLAVPGDYQVRLTAGGADRHPALRGPPGPALRPPPRRTWRRSSASCSRRATS